ncbi:MAG: hypothetical protein MJ252_15600 [archaeon]|nr:hypothetical protein [archaeon]
MMYESNNETKKVNLLGQSINTESAVSTEEDTAPKMLKFEEQKNSLKLNVKILFLFLEKTILFFSILFFNFSFFT